MKSVVQLHILSLHLPRMLPLHDVFPSMALYTLISRKQMLLRSVGQSSLLRNPIECGRRARTLPDH